MGAPGLAVALLLLLLASAAGVSSRVDVSRGPTFRRQLAGDPSPFPGRRKCWQEAHPPGRGKDTAATTPMTWCGTLSRGLCPPCAERASI